MRIQLAATCATALTAMSLGCAGAPTLTAPAGSSVAAPQVSLGALYERAGSIESALALYDIAVDPVTLSATASLRATRSGQANDDLYELPIGRFLGAEGFRIDRVRRTPSHIELDWTLTHPFPAPSNPEGAPNGSSNRADLGVAGRVLVLAEVASAAGNTYFGDRIANTALVANADAYWSPEKLLTLSTTANLFPYQSFIDESGPTGTRTGQSNGGDPTGNFGIDGWTRAEFGAGNAGWTGFGVLHQGQATTRTLQLSRATLEAAGPVRLTVALVAKYNDPRGGLTSIAKRGNRLPPATPDAMRFAYRMPHGALDVERLSLQSTEGLFAPNVISAATFRFQLTDWDARAIETAFPDLAEDPDVTTVALGESGIPALAVCIPGVLGDATFADLWDGSTLLDDDSAYGGDVDSDTGRPGDPLFFAKLVTKNAGSGQTGGTYTGLVRATDPETLLAGGLTIPLDGDLQPVTGRAPEPVTYQAFVIDMGAVNLPPSATATVTSPLVPTGTAASIAVSSVADPDSPTVQLLVDWDDDGTDDYTSPPIAVPAAGPLAYNSFTHGGLNFTFTAPAPDYRNLRVRLTDGLDTVDITPAAGANGEHFEVIELIPGWVRTYGTATGTTRFWDVAIDAAGNAYCAGYYIGGTDFGTGPVASVGAEDLAVIKLDPYGTRVWHWVAGSIGKDEVQAIAVDAAGNAYLAGAYAGAINFGGGARTFAGNIGDAFLLRLNADGTYAWDKTFSTGSDDRGFGVGVNDAGTQVAFTGFVGSGMNFGGGPHPGNRRFVVTYDPAGTYLWNPGWDVNLGTNIYGDVGYDHTGAIIAIGHFKNTVNFGGGPRTVLGYDPGPPVIDPDDAFLVKWDAAGTYLWDKQVGGLSTEVGQAMAIDSGNNIYLAGKAFGSANYGSTTAPAANTFLVKVSPAGVYQWDYWFTNNGSNWGCAIDAADNVLLCGGYTGSVDFGGGLRTSSGFASFVLKRSAAGAYVWDATFATGAGVNYSLGLGVAADNSVRVAGNFDGTEDFMPGPGVFNVTAPGTAYHAFVSRINANGLW